VIRRPLIAYVATLGPVGYLPAPGTAATLVTLPLIWFLSTHGVQLYAYGCILLASILAGIVLTNYTLKKWSLGFDPSEIVIDEYAGCLTTFFAVPVHQDSLVVGFLLFRFFDIFKPFGIYQLQSIKGGWGIMVDDIAAGIISNIILRIVFM